MTTEQKITILEKALALPSEERTTPAKASAYLLDMNGRKQKDFYAIIKIDPKYYLDFLKSNPHLDANEETLYIAHQDNKAFMSGMGGYSIFAQSLGALKRKVARPTGMPEIDRIERAPALWAVLVYETNDGIFFVRKGGQLSEKVC